MKKSSKEFKQLQRDRILKVKPWLRSTGAMTHEGKQKSKMNALKMDPETYALFKQFERLIRQQKVILKMLN